MARKLTKVPNNLSPDDKIVQEAQDNFKQWQNWESDFVTLYKDDVKFNMGDSDNGWQWPKDLRKEREKNKRPALTINKTQQKVNMLVNDGRQNKPSITIKPVGDQTSFKAAQIYEGLVRHIEYISKAQAIYDQVTESQIEGGIGYFRVTTKYSDDGIINPDSLDKDAFDQDIIFEPIRNQLGVALDFNIKQIDGSDAKWAIIFDDVPRKEAERLYPNADLNPTTTSLGGPDTWLRPDAIRVAEYYRVKETKDEVVWMTDPGGTSAVFLRSGVPPKFRKQLDDADSNGSEIQRRPIQIKQLEWYKIVGNSIVERIVDLPGPYIPIVRVVGVERVIDGKLHRKGLVRDLKDPQRMYNYNSSGQVEYGALATKTPWVGPASAFEGNTDAWNRANTDNAAYLTYRDYDDELNREIKAPQRPEAPGSSPAFLSGMQIAEHEIDMASGQFESHDGKVGRERSGRAIAETQRQGDTAGYHFIDHLSLGLRYAGMIVLAWAPKVYDTERVIQIMGRDGVQSKVQIKPDMQQAMQEQQDKDVVQVMFNPKIGKYLVESDVGPAYSTQRQEAWNAFVQIVTGAPDLINEIGDLMFQSADFPLADKIAERLRNKIRADKPYLFDDNAPTPQMQQMQGEIKQLTDQVGLLLQQLAENRLKLVGKEQMRDIDAFDSYSKRITAISNAQPELARTGQEAELKAAVAQTLHDIIHGPNIVSEVNAADQPGGGIDQAVQQGAPPPVDGARQAPDGNWYLQHPQTGQHLRVDAAA